MHTSNTLGRQWEPKWDVLFGVMIGTQRHTHTHTHQKIFSLKQSPQMKNYDFSQQIQTFLTFCIKDIMWQIRPSPPRPTKRCAPASGEKTFKLPRMIDGGGVTALVIRPSVRIHRSPQTPLFIYHWLQRSKTNRTDFIQINCTAGRQFSILFHNEGGFVVVATERIQSGQISGP